MCCPVYIYIYIYNLFDPEGLPYKFLVFAPEVRRWTGDPPETLSSYIYII